MLAWGLVSTFQAFMVGRVGFFITRALIGFCEGEASFYISRLRLAALFDQLLTCAHSFRTQVDSFQEQCT